MIHFSLVLAKREITLRYIRRVVILEGSLLSGIVNICEILSLLRRVATFEKLRYLGQAKNFHCCQEEVGKFYFELAKTEILEEKLK